MSKLYFRYGAMNCGKTTALLQVAHNYEERNMKVIILKPKINNKNENNVITKIGLKKKINHLIEENEKLSIYLNNLSNDYKCILVDEAQFLSRDQVDDLFMFSKFRNVPVICYGLKTDFRTLVFPGSLRLFEVSDELEELYTICSCGKKAKFTARIIDGKYTSLGSQILIDNNVSYESLCGKCYLEKVLGINENNFKE